MFKVSLGGAVGLEFILRLVVIVFRTYGTGSQDQSRLQTMLSYGFTSASAILNYSLTFLLLLCIPSQIL